MILKPGQGGKPRLKSICPICMHLRFTCFDWRGRIETEKGGRKRISLISLRQLSAALDREYGWTVAPEPGKSEEIVANLAQSDMWLARQLFNPTLYSILKDKE